MSELPGGMRVPTLRISSTGAASSWDDRSVRAVSRPSTTRMRYVFSTRPGTPGATTTWCSRSRLGSDWRRTANATSSWTVTCWSAIRVIRTTSPGERLAPSGRSTWSSGPSAMSAPARRSATVPRTERTFTSWPPSMRVTGSPRSSATRWPGTTGASLGDESRSPTPVRSPSPRSASATVSDDVRTLATSPSTETVRGAASAPRTTPRGAATARLGTTAVERAIGSGPRSVHVPMPTRYVTRASRPKRKKTENTCRRPTKFASPNPPGVRTWRCHDRNRGGPGKSSGLPAGLS